MSCLASALQSLLLSRLVRFRKQDSLYPSIRTLSVSHQYRPTNMCNSMGSYPLTLLPTSQSARALFLNLRRRTISMAAKLDAERSAWLRVQYFHGPDPFTSSLFSERSKYISFAEALIQGHQANSCHHHRPSA